jgi:restriction system protein
LAQPVDDVVDPEEALAADGQDIIRYSRDRILSRIKERFAGYDLQDLVAELLRAEGMKCKVPPQGSDGGIDIIAGSGVLGIVARQTLWQGLLVAEAAPLLKGLSHHESSTDDPGGEEAPHRVVRVAG